MKVSNLTNVGDIWEPVFIFQIFENNEQSAFKREYKISVIDILVCK